MNEPDLKCAGPDNEWKRVELPHVTADAVLTGRVFFKGCEQLPDCLSTYRRITFYNHPWDTEKLSSLLDGAILSPNQKQRILSHDSYAEITLENEGAVHTAWRMVESLVRTQLYEMAVGVQVQSFVYPRFFRTAFFNSLNLVGTRFELSPDGNLVYTSRGMHELGFQEVEYVLPIELQENINKQPAWLKCSTTQELVSLVTKPPRRGDYISLIVPFRGILDDVLLGKIPDTPGVYVKAHSHRPYLLEHCLLSTGVPGLRITELTDSMKRDVYKKIVAKGLF